MDRAYAPGGRRRLVEAVDAARRTGPVKIVLGAGRVPIDGWINTDIVWGHTPYFLDATVPWPVGNDTVDYVYGDDMIEHVTLEQARALFVHAFAALKPGGVLRLATPDVEAVARQYLENGELAQMGLRRNAELGRDLRHPVELLRQVYVGAEHYRGFIYDFDSLSAEMASAGFEVARVESGESEHAALRGLETRTHPAERATSLVVEGTKPAG